MKCDICKKEYSPNCDYRQGRCPHHPAMIENILENNYKARYFHLYRTIKSFISRIFKK